MPRDNYLEFNHLSVAIRMFLLPQITILLPQNSENGIFYGEKHKCFNEKTWMILQKTWIILQKTHYFLRKT